MPTKKLTDLFVERAKPPAHGRVEYFDAAFGGLALRITEHGHKSWSLHYRFGGRLRRLTIGDARWINPAQARREAAAALERGAKEWTHQSKKGFSGSRQHSALTTSVPCSKTISNDMRP